MQELTLIGPSDDGSRLLFGTLSDNPIAYVLITDDLRRIVHAKTASNAPSDSPTEPATHVAPRDIQAMIRSGMGVAEVAETSGWTADKVARFAAPILAERAHVAEVAGRTPVRSRGVPSATTVYLRDRVDLRLRERGVCPDHASWDAHKSDTGQWLVTLSFSAGDKSRTACWSFSKTSQVLEPCDDEARWLSEDDRPTPARTTHPVHASPSTFTYADLTSAASPPHVSVEVQPRSRATDRLAPVVHLTEAVPIPVALHEHRRNPLQRRPLFDPNQPSLDDHVQYRDALAGDDPYPDETDAPPFPHVRRGQARRARRASVPTWDEVMFGTGRTLDA